MPHEFEGDLAGAEFWGVDLRGATFRDADLTGARITHSLVVDVEIDAFVDRLVVNGVDVTDVVNRGDPWYALRAATRAATPEEMRSAWSALDAAWSATIADARARPEAELHASVGGEWSFVETVRHLVFAMDKWLTVPLTGGPFHPIGLPNTGSRNLPWPGVDLALTPTADDALSTFADRTRRVGEHLAGLTADDLTSVVEVPESGPFPLLECFRTVFEEAFWHLRYARRDLEALAARS